MYPPARSLDKAIKERGAKTVFYMTWGRQNGDKGNFKNDTFEAMQERLKKGYEGIAKELSAIIAPVGLAWKEALREKPGLDLWAEDGSHPNDQGAYLTACVFFATFFKKSPVGLRFTGNLSKQDATFLQTIAARVALKK